MCVGGVLGAVEETMFRIMGQNQLLGGEGIECQLLSLNFILWAVMSHGSHLRLYLSACPNNPIAEER